MLSKESLAPPQERLNDFILCQVEPRWGTCEVVPLPGDASTRRYFRLVAGDGSSQIAAVYPEPFDEENFSYRQVYLLLRDIGVPVPESYVFDGPRGIVLQQDLGDQWLLIWLGGVSNDRWIEPLREALQWITRIQSLGTASCPPDYPARRLAFDLEKLTAELNFFYDQYLLRYRGRRPDGPDEAALRSEFAAVAGRLADCPRYLTHRDYHCRNIMLFEGRQYVIDFQDARMGPASYDLVSLLKDSIDLPAAAVDGLVEDFLALGRLDAEERRGFRSQFELMSVQRLLKALGTYGYQIAGRGNPIYARYVPGTLKRAHASAVRVDSLPAIRAMLENELAALPRDGRQATNLL